MQRYSWVRRAKWGLVLVALLSFVSAGAHASTICDEGCSENGGSDSDATDPLGFGTVLRPDDGSSVRLGATGTVYLFGAFTTNGGDVRLYAENNISIDVGDLDLSGINLILTANNSVDIGSTGDVIAPPIASLPRLDDGRHEIGLGGDITLASFDNGNEELAFAAVTGSSANGSGNKGGDIIGNVYLDLSGLTLSDIAIEAGQDIIWTIKDPTVVPQPRTALLMGLGLTLLSARRGTRR